MNKPTPYFSVTIGVLLLIVIWAVLFLLTEIASAAEPSACGVGGTAKIADGSAVTKTDAEAAGLQIKADGYWWTCRVPPMLVQPPASCPPAREGIRTWTVNGQTCTTARKGSSTSKDKTIKHNDTAIWFQWSGEKRGHLLERCFDGVRTVIGATCAPATHCDVLWSFGDGRRTYSYDARVKPVPIGETVQAVAADGRTMPIRCVAGNFSRVR